MKETPYTRDEIIEIANDIYNEGQVCQDLVKRYYDFGVAREKVREENVGRVYEINEPQDDMGGEEDGLAKFIADEIASTFLIDGEPHEQLTEAARVMQKAKEQLDKLEYRICEMIGD